MSCSAVVSVLGISGGGCWLGKVKRLGRIGEF